jgi:hypothetical protein
VLVALLLVPAAASALSWTTVQSLPQVPGTKKIWDADATRLLYVDISSGEPLPWVKILSRAGQITTVHLPTDMTPRFAYLTPGGVIVNAQRSSDSLDELFEWRNNTLVDLGPVAQLRVAGGYAAWIVGPSAAQDDLYRRDLVGGTSVKVASAVSNVEVGVGTNGDVTYSKNGHVFRWRNGVTMQISRTVAGRLESHSQTDGSEVVYMAGPTCCAGTHPENELDLWDGTGEVTLGPRADTTFSRDRRWEVEVEHGWVFARLYSPAGLPNDELRDPEGSVEMTGTVGRLVGLSPNGQAITGFNSNSVPYQGTSELLRSDHAPVSLPDPKPSEFGERGRDNTDHWAAWIDGRWMQASGTDLLALTNPDYVNGVRGTAGLRAYWRLGETSGGTAADELGAHSGTFVGSVNRGQPGGIVGDANLAAGFDGGGYVRTPSLGSSTDFTVEGWTYLTPASRTSPNGDNSLFARWGTLRLIARPNGIYGDVFANGAKEGLLQASTPRNVYRWVHWAMVREGSTLTLYRNGQKVASKAGLSPAATQLQGAIGAQDGSDSSGDNSYRLHGEADDVAVYDRALPAATIKAHFDASG